MSHAQAAVQKLRVTYEKFGRPSGILPRYNGTDKKIPQLDLITYETVKLNRYCTVYYCSLIYEPCLHKQGSLLRLSCYVTEPLCFF